MQYKGTVDSNTTSKMIVSAIIALTNFSSLVPA